MLRPSKRIKSLGLIFGLGMMFIPATLFGQDSDPCNDHQSQADLNACEAKHFKSADVEMNQAYRQLLTKYRSDAEFVKKLKLAQRAWLNYRDADMDSLYYQRDKPLAYGSVFPMCWAMEMTELTSERTKELKSMLDVQEGDVCGFSAASGSSRTNPQMPGPGSRGVKPVRLCAAASALAPPVR